MNGSKVLLPLVRYEIVEIIALLLLAPFLFSDGPKDGADQKLFEQKMTQSGVVRVERLPTQTVFHPPENRQLTLTVLVSTTRDGRSPAGLDTGSIEIVVSAP